MAKRNFLFTSSSSVGTSHPSFSGGGVGGHRDDETASITSDATYSSEIGWAQRLGLSRDSSELDDMMKNLYLDPDILEAKCRDISVGVSRRMSVGGTLYHDKSINDTPKEAWEVALAAGAGANAGIKVSKTPEEVVANLYEGYFEPDFDPIERQLNEISSWDDEDMMDRFMATIEETDTDKDMVLTQLADMISLNYTDLMACMRDVHAIDVDLARTGIMITNSRRQLNSGKDLIVTGTLHITKLKHYRDNLSVVHLLLQKLQSLKNLYESVQEDIKIGDVGKAAESCYQVILTLQDDSYYAMQGAQRYGESIQKLLPLLRRRSDKTLFRTVSRKFAASEYESVIRSYLLLDHMQESMGVQITSPNDRQKPDSEEDTLEYDDDGCMEGLARRIHRFQMIDIKTCIRSTVVELMCTGGGIHALGDLDITEMSDEELYQKITPSLVVPCVVRATEMLASVIHTNYLITQWHLTPFDERNSDLHYLHRCPIEHAANQDFFSEDESSEEESDDEQQQQQKGRDSAVEQEKRHEKKHPVGTGAGGGGGVRDDVLRDIIISGNDTLNGGGAGGGGDATDQVQLSPTEIRHQRLQSARLSDANQSLVACRILLWKEVEKAIITLFHAISPSSAIPFEDFASMIWALQTMIKLGTEFCHSESRGLQQILAVKCVEYANSVHIDSFRQLKVILESEPWRSVPINLNEMGGVLGIIKLYVLKPLQQQQLQLATAAAAAAAGNVTEGGGAAQRIRIKGMIHEAMAIAERRNNLLAATRSNLAAKYNSAMASSSASEEDSHLHRQQLHPTDTFNSNVSDESILMSFVTLGNPFHFMTEGEGTPATAAPTATAATVATTTAVATPTTPAKSNAAPPVTPDSARGTAAPQPEVNLLIEALTKLLEDDTVVPMSRRAQQQSSAMIVTQASLHGLAKYSGKYLHMMQLMPSAAPEIFGGLCQLFDYYIAAVFVGFVSYDERQKLFAKALPRSIAPPPLQAKDFEALQRRMSYLFSFSQRNTGNWSPSVTSGGGGGSNSNSWEESSAELETQAIQFTNIFSWPDLVKNILPPHSMLNPDPTTFFGLNERIVAAESCWFAAKILSELKPKVLCLLPEAHKQTSEYFISDFQQISGQLRSLIYRAMCPDLVKQAEILSLMSEQSGWELKKMREEPHEWVDILIDNCVEVWEYMEQCDEFGDASSSVREQVWLELCQAAFDIVLEGLSRVKKCSTEGRASMTMDVSALHTGLDSRHVCRPPRGRNYVDVYIKALYLTEDETIRWALSQTQTYAHRHLQGLLKQALSSMMANRKLSQALSALDAEYDNAERDESKLSNMLSQRLR